MAFGQFQGSVRGRDQAMSEINMVPLIDIVLVLLVLFILAAPMAAQSVLVSLPKTQPLVTQEPAETLNISLRQDGVLLNEEGETLDEQALLDFLAQAMLSDEPPAIRIWSDEDARYAYLADVIVKIRQAGVTKISLMTRTTAQM
ncbi:ExbD/TolR family protein [Orrella sp. 11846]|uniref:ExbD/TolR family protein n=1 Tax=Orrella sp. 11846 TaxID=3409913 RepID=UPI003B5AC75C